MQKTFASFAFGCRVNQAEKEMLNRQLIENGFNYSQTNPNIYIINTCAVTKKAEREARQMINQIKYQYHDTKIIVTGCAATKWIIDNNKIENADLLIDNTNKEFIASILSKRYTKLTKNSKSTNFDKQKNIGKYLGSGRMLVKIQDGCQRFCTFCIVPYLRGQPKSFRIKNLVLRIKNQEDNISEVILTAINTQAFGFDTGESFIELIQTIIDKTNVPRISFGSIHPWSINDDFFEFYKKILPQKRLVDFFHIPLQSGSNKILSLMRRGYTSEEFLEKLNNIYKIYPLTFIGTDIIVGFLEENTKDFEDTHEFLKKSPISKIHVFRFSQREHTPAYFMSKRLKNVSEIEKKNRSKILIKLSSFKYNIFLNQHLNKTFSALFLERRKDCNQEVLLENQIPALIRSEKNFVGQIKMVKIERIKKEKLLGKLN